MPARRPAMLLLLFVSVALVVAAGLWGGVRFFYRQQPPELTATGKQMYEDYCAGCHKSSGVGAFIFGIPPVYGHNLDRAKVVRLIRFGDPDYPRMPVFPEIRFSQAHKIAKHVEELSHRHQVR